MVMNQRSSTLQRLTVIVNCGKGSKVIQRAKKCGVQGATVLMGLGTARGRVAELLSLTDVRREIVMMAAEQEVIQRTLDTLDQTMHLTRPGHGIAYIADICFVAGARHYTCDLDELRKGVKQAMYQAITVIVDKGKAEMVIDAAIRVGAKGGTIINARGSGIHETSRLFGMDIEPEKEMVLILAKTENAGTIVTAVSDDLKINEPGNGIIFVQPVDQVIGMAD